MYAPQIQYSQIFHQFCLQSEGDQLPRIPLSDASAVSPFILMGFRKEHSLHP